MAQGDALACPTGIKEVLELIHLGFPTGDPVEALVLQPKAGDVGHTAPNHRWHIQVVAKPRACHRLRQRGAKDGPVRGDLCGCQQGVIPEPHDIGPTPT
jgi:hypothetical protein